METHASPPLSGARPFAQVFNRDSDALKSCFGFGRLKQNPVDITHKISSGQLTCTTSVSVSDRRPARDRIINFNPVVPSRTGAIRRGRGYRQRLPGIQLANQPLSTLYHICHLSHTGRFLTRRRQAAPARRRGPQTVTPGFASSHRDHHPAGRHVAGPAGKNIPSPGDLFPLCDTRYCRSGPIGRRSRGICGRPRENARITPTSEDRRPRPGQASYESILATAPSSIRRDVRPAPGNLPGRRRHF